MASTHPAMNPSRFLSPWIPIAALAFAIAHLAFEHFNGGVKTHHFLARGDLPGLSNWLALAILPLVGLALAMRVKSMQGAQSRGVLPPPMVAPVAGAMAYGAVLAASFHFGAQQVSVAAFMGLFVCALVLPVYRAEYIFGFILGMTFTFGSAIPLVVALVVATLSYVVRGAAGWAIAALRRPRGSR